MPSYYAPVVMDMFTYFLSFNYTKVINFFFSTTVSECKF
ncbi:unnamed protein product [Tenebrio molitor]|nr:unnamed protein product [Tenebrio molitor]